MEYRLRFFKDAYFSISYAPGRGSYTRGDDSKDFQRANTTPVEAESACLLPAFFPAAKRIAESNVGAR